MSGFVQADLQALLSAADSAPHAQAKGAAFEAALKYLFESVGTLVVQNSISHYGTEQIDLAVANHGVFPGLPSRFLVEAKNYDAPVDSKAVGYFLYICISRSSKLAVIVAANGLTGNGDERTAAYSLAKSAQAFECCLVVITRADLDSLTSASDFINLLERRYLSAFASDGLGV